MTESNDDFSMLVRNLQGTIKEQTSEIRDLRNSKERAVQAAAFNESRISTWIARYNEMKSILETIFETGYLPETGLLAERYMVIVKEVTDEQQGKTGKGSTSSEEGREGLGRTGSSRASR